MLDFVTAPRHASSSGARHEHTTDSFWYGVSAEAALLLPPRRERYQPFCSDAPSTERWSRAT